MSDAELLLGWRRLGASIILQAVHDIKVAVRAGLICEGKVDPTRFRRGGQYHNSRGRRALVAGMGRETEFHQLIYFFKETIDEFLVEYDLSIDADLIRQKVLAWTAENVPIDRGSDPEEILG